MSYPTSTQQTLHQPPILNTSNRNPTCTIQSNINMVFRRLVVQVSISQLMFSLIPLVLIATVTNGSAIALIVLLVWMAITGLFGVISGCKSPNAASPALTTNTISPELPSSPMFIKIFTGMVGVSLVLVIASIIQGVVITRGGVGRDPSGILSMAFPGFLLLVQLIMLSILIRALHGYATLHTGNQLGQPMNSSFPVVVGGYHPTPTTIYPTSGQEAYSQGMHGGALYSQGGPYHVGDQSGIQQPGFTYGQGIPEDGRITGPADQPPSYQEFQALTQVPTMNKTDKF